MNHFRKLLLTIGLAASFLTVLYPTTDIAMSASAPGVNVLPAITSGISTPVRLASDSSGNIYATDPHAGGILKYNSAGTLVQKIVTPKSVSGIAIAPTGNLLVTQGSYVVVLNPATGNEINRFGTFSVANGIAVDPANNAYVTDSKSDVVKKFTYSGGVYSLSLTSDPDLLLLFRPAGIAYDKYNNRLAIANSLIGTIELVNPLDLSPLETIGDLGYDPHPAYPAFPLFSNPQGISFEYNPGSGVLNRIYVAESFQGNIQVLDGVTNARIGDIGGYGLINGKLFAPSDVLFDQFSLINKRLFVANGGGTLAVFGIDNLQPTNIQVGSATLNSLTVSWSNPTGQPTFSRIRIYRSSVAGQLGSQIGVDQTGSSYIDSGLNPGTTYYYTVRAVDTNNTVMANTQPVSGTTRINYTLTLTTVGAGSINGTVSCGENTVCPIPVLDNTVVNLTAVPNALSATFTGWSGDCTGLTDTCQVTMGGIRNVTASFSQQKPFKVNGTYFDTLQESYNAASNGSVIEIMAGTRIANSATGIMIADRPITVTLKGGYNSDYTDPPSSGNSLITGRIVIQAGKLIMNNVRIK
jgi:hypothetical protein